MSIQDDRGLDQADKDSELVQRKEIFFNVLKSSRESLTTAEKRGKQIARDARFLRDAADCTEAIINVLPENALPVEQWDNLIGSWQDVQSEGKSLEGLNQYADSFSAVASASGITMTSVFQVVSVPPVYSDEVKFGKIDYELIHRKIDQFYLLFDKDALAAEVRALIIRFGLDSRSEDIRSALELFEDAVAALQLPSASDDSPVAIMIPLRECIDLIIDRLLKKRQKQELTGKKREDKLCSIGSQCGKEGRTSNYFRRLGGDADILRNELSTKKQLALPRKESLRLFERGALFIKALLTSIDENKLKA